MIDASDKTKVDFKKLFSRLYAPPADHAIEVDVPKLKFLMIDGQGDPETSAEFQAAFGVLYGISFTIKMMPKKGVVPPGYYDYTVGPLEGLWWGTPMEHGNWEAGEALRDQWQWTLMIMQPDFVTAELFEQAKDQLHSRRPAVQTGSARLEDWEEGHCVQMMHVGPYDVEKKTLDQLEQYCEENGLKMVGKHHEIYLGDPRRTKPERLKTVLRHPVVRA